MIRINLLPLRKQKRADRGRQSLAIGLAAVAVASAVLYFAVHRPAVGELARLKRVTSQLTRENQELEKEVAKLGERQEEVAHLESRVASVARLQKARVTPAYLLRELSNITTPGRAPTMSKESSKRADSPHRRLALDWDPKHVWISSLKEQDGVFTLEGGAQSDGDMTQLAKRMEASVYFQDVDPKGGSEIEDKASGISYYKFTITGKVVY